MIACSKRAGRGNRRDTGREAAVATDSPLASESDLLSAGFKSEGLAFCRGSIAFEVKRFRAPA